MLNSDLTDIEQLQHARHCSQCFVLVDPLNPHIEPTLEKRKPALRVRITHLGHIASDGEAGVQT